MKTSALIAMFLLASHLHAAETITYSCDNGEKLAITYGTAADGRPQATVRRTDGDLVLPQVAAASGARYRADPVDLHTKGDDAFLEDEQGRQLRCSRGAPAAAATPSATAASSFITLTGGVAYRTRNALPPDAILVILVHDVARAGAPARVLAEQRYELNGAQVPIFFTATIDRDLIGKRARIQVAARIEIDGQLHYINDRAYPALANGQPLPLAIMLKPVATSPR
jgi:putative lipoprotein